MADTRAVPIGEQRFSGKEQKAVTSPYDGKELARIPVCEPADVDRAVAAAKDALANNPLAPWKRAEILDTAARLLKERNEEFARTIAGEAAKPIKTARVEAQRAISTFTFAATEARKLSGEMVPIEASEVGNGKLAFTLPIPIGVVGAISPFNFPLNLVAHKVAPAIAAGCPDTLAKLVGDLVVGDPMDENTDVSALITPDDCTRVKEWIDEAVGAGAEVVTGGDVADGLLQPTVLRNVTNDMRVMREEVFGPVVGIQIYRDIDEALALANDTDYGLQAGIFTKNLDYALAAGRTLEFAGVTVNEVPTWRADQMPYGGVKASGNTKEGPPYSVREMTEFRLVIVQPS